MTRSSKVALTVFGAALMLLGAFIWLRGEVTLPTRHPPRAFHFNGLSLFLLGSSPFGAGLLSLAGARGVVERESKLAQAVIVGCLAALGLAFFLAPKGE